MIKLSENVYNKTLRQDEAKLKVWRYAGLMLTYQCPARCEFCYCNCGPDKSGLMPVETAIAAWRSLERMGGKDARVHITGGEPFVFFDHMVEILAEAARAKLRGPETIETNAFWAQGEKVVRDRLRLLDRLGMERLKISCDPFHAEFVDVEHSNPLEAQVPVVPDASTCSGRRCVIFRVDSREGRRDTSRNLLPTGRRILPDSFAGDNCAAAFLSARGVHIDPYGNVFSGLCSGIVVGNVCETLLEDIWKGFHPGQNDIIERLFAEGPFGLLSAARQAGYDSRSFYAGKCHLCMCLRQFFFDKQEYETIIGPCECYSLR